MAMLNNRKQQEDTREVRTDKVVYPDTGEIVFIKRVNRDSLKDFWELQCEVLEIYVKSNASFAAIMMDDDGYTLLKTMCEMVPIKGTTTAYLDFLRLEDDYEQLERLFCNSSITDNSKESALEEGIKPSIISLLHRFDYQGAVGKLWKEHRAEQEKQEALELETLTQTSLLNS